MQQKLHCITFEVSAWRPQRLRFTDRPILQRANVQKKVEHTWPVGYEIHNANCRSSRFSNIEEIGEKQYDERTVWSRSIFSLRGKSIQQTLTSFIRTKKNHKKYFRNSQNVRSSQRDFNSASFALEPFLLNDQSWLLKKTPESSQQHFVFQVSIPLCFFALVSFSTYTL